MKANCRMLSHFMTCHGEESGLCCAVGLPAQAARHASPTTAARAPRIRHVSSKYSKHINTLLQTRIRPYRAWSLNGKRVEKNMWKRYEHNSVEQSRATCLSPFPLFPMEWTLFGERNYYRSVECPTPLATSLARPHGPRSAPGSGGFTHGRIRFQLLMLCR